LVRVFPLPFFVVVAVLDFFADIFANQCLGYAVGMRWRVYPGAGDEKRRKDKTVIFVICRREDPQSNLPP
jgi:hypothetical protein